MDLASDADKAVELAARRPRGRLGLNPRSSAGLSRKRDDVLGQYGPGDNCCRALGADSAGNAYVPLRSAFSAPASENTGTVICRWGRAVEPLTISSILWAVLSS